MEDVNKATGITKTNRVNRPYYNEL